ncbi:MAG: VapC toxin family PIN domain ribonuclease [Thiotrichaceae bacterium IS1]|nr:MAG: VapC toxin family PIN domain ribonuclease [Thiotrichaceae bacterium IS1]
MNIIADANTFLVTALEEPEKPLIVSLSNGCELFSPEILHYEIGNALIAMIRRKRLTYAEAKRAYQLTQVVPVKLLKPDLEVSLEIAYQYQLYAYDAFYLQCALQHQMPLLTLDKRMKQVAKQLSLTILE